MKTTRILSLITLLTLGSIAGFSQVSTNDFFDDAETHILQGNTSINVEGEISNPGIVDITKLPERSLIIKEALADGQTNKFVGAYRYDGYSLYDILNDFILAKKNVDEFPPIIDMFVKVENDGFDLKTIMEIMGNKTVKVAMISKIYFN